ncbi:MAG TPA: YgcG family protein [Steroidobacteraceae bacterium]|jgi:uncharacterized protein
MKPYLPLRSLLHSRHGVSVWLTARPGSGCYGSGFFALLAFLCFIPAAFAQVAVPPLRSPVTDLTHTLTAQQAASLEQTLRAYEARKGSQIAVLIVPTTQPEDIEQYSIRVAEQWKLGRKGVDDGAILLVAKDDHAVRIEVGYGLEGALPDVMAGRIVSQVILPHFRSGDFAGGIAEGVTRMIAVTDGEPLPAPAQNDARRHGAPQGIGSILPVLLMVVFVGGTMLRRTLGAFGGASVIGGVAGVIAWFLTSVMGIAFGAAVIGFLFTLLGGGGGGGGWSSGRGGWGGGGFGGGSWGGGGFGGGGGGGWSGGGGGFGGGGASGRW